MICDISYMIYDISVSYIRYSLQIYHISYIIYDMLYMIYDIKIKRAGTDVEKVYKNASKKAMVQLERTGAST